MELGQIKKPVIGDMPWVSCDCGSNIFEKKMMFKKCSAILSPTGREEFIPIEVIVCTKCNKIPEFVAKNLNISQ